MAEKIAWLVFGFYDGALSLIHLILPDILDPTVSMNIEVSASEQSPQLWFD